MLEVKNNYSRDMQAFLKAARAITTLVSQQDEKSPYTETVFQVLEVYREPFRARHILEWTDKLDPDLLSKAPRYITDAQGCRRELASDREQYFKLRSEAFYRNHQSHECIEICQTALSSLKSFHHQNDIWFKRRIALAQYALGEFENAATLLLDLYQLRGDWFFLKEIADIFYELGDIRRALYYATKAAMEPGEIKTKINCFKLLNRIFEKTKQKSLAKRHAELVFAIYKENRWTIKAKVTRYMRDYGFELKTIGASASIVRALLPEWEKIRFAQATQKIGKIETVDLQKGGGIVSTESGDCYTFLSKDSHIKAHELRHGKKVSFYLDSVFDKKSQTLKKRALALRLI